MFLCVYDTLCIVSFEHQQPIFTKSYTLAPLKLRPRGAIQICLLLLLLTFIYIFIVIIIFIENVFPHL